MKKIIIFIIMVCIMVNIINASDDELMITGMGDDELVIGINFADGEIGSILSGITVPTTPEEVNISISYVYSISNVDLSIGTATNVYTLFNVTNNGGIGEINISSTIVQFIKSGEQTRTSSLCLEVQNDSVNVMEINCTILMYYYDGSGVWNININVSNNNGELAQSNSETLTVNDLDSILLNDTSINCGTSLTPGTNDIKCDVIRINNTGNQDYTSINYTTYNLDDDSTGSYIFDVNNFNVNITDSPSGDILSNATPVIITNAILNKGEGSSEELYNYLDVPNGYPSDIYNSITDWQLEFIQ